MSFLGIRVPHEISRLLSAIEIPGEKVPRDEMHISLLYVGKQTPIEQLVKVIMAAFPVTSECTPFTVTTRRVTSFPTNPDDGVPIIAPIESATLHDLHSSLCKAFDDAKVEYSKKYPIYKPHVTLGYSKDPGVFAEMVADKDIVPAVEWGVGEIVLWGGDKGDDKLCVTFPFRLTDTDKAASRGNALRAALHGIVRLTQAGLKRAHNPDGTCPKDCPCHGEPLVHKVAARYKAQV
jgi:2'-5' RNA ligase